MVFARCASRRAPPADAQAYAQHPGPAASERPAAVVAMPPNRWGDCPPPLVLAFEAEGLGSPPARALAAGHAMVMGVHPGFWLQRLVDSCATAAELVARIGQVSTLSFLAEEIGIGDDTLQRLAFLAALHVGPSGLRADVAEHLGDAAWCRAKLTKRRPADSTVQRLLGLWVYSYRTCTELDLSSRRLYDTDLRALIPGLRGMVRLQVLRMLNNCFTSQAAPLVDFLARKHSGLLRMAATTLFGADRLVDSTTKARKTCEQRRLAYEAGGRPRIEVLEVQHAVVIENEVAAALTLALEAQTHGAGVLAVLRGNEFQVPALRALDIDQVRDWSRDDLVASVEILGLRARNLRCLRLRVDLGALGARDGDEQAGWRRRVVGAMVGLGEIRELSLSGWRFAGDEMQALCVVAQRLPFWCRLEGATGPSLIPAADDQDGWELYLAAHQTRVRIGRLLESRNLTDPVDGSNAVERERGLHAVIAGWAGDLARYHCDALRVLSGGPPPLAPRPIATTPLNQLARPPQAAAVPAARAAVTPSKAVP